MRLLSTVEVGLAGTGPFRSRFKVPPGIEAASAGRRQRGPMFGGIAWSKSPRSGSGLAGSRPGRPNWKPGLPGGHPGAAPPPRSVAPCARPTQRGLRSRTRQLRPAAVHCAPLRIARAQRAIRDCHPPVLAPLIGALEQVGVRMLSTYISVYFV
jgi:hypothetical protein